MPTGWRPADVVEKYPVPKINDVYHFEKYDTKASTGLHIWCWVQLIVLLLFISYLFGNIAAIGSPGMFIYGGFVFIFVYALTELMDRHVWSVFWETAKCGVGLYLLYSTGDWFGAGSTFPWLNIVLTVYFITSFAVTSWFAWKHYREDYQVNSGARLVNN